MIDWKSHAERLAADDGGPARVALVPAAGRHAPACVRAALVDVGGDRRTWAYRLHDGPSDPKRGCGPPTPAPRWSPGSDPARRSRRARGHRPRVPAAPRPPRCPTWSSRCTGRVPRGHLPRPGHQGSGYGTALACTRLGDEQVTSVDVDPYLTSAPPTGWPARLHLHGAVRDITRGLPGEFDRIVSTVAVPRIPARGWPRSPRRPACDHLAGTGLIVVADKTPDGGAVGHVAPESAGFMTVRHGDDYDEPSAGRRRCGGRPARRGREHHHRPLSADVRPGHLGPYAPHLNYRARHRPPPDGRGRPPHRLHGPRGRLVGPRHGRRRRDSRPSTRADRGGCGMNWTASAHGSPWMATFPSAAPR